MAEEEGGHKGHEAADEDGTKPGIGKELKKRPWLWLLVVTAAGIAGWAIYNHFAGGTSTATTGNAPEPLAGDDSGGSSGGSGADDSAELEALAAEISSNEESTLAALGALQAGQQPPTVNLYVGSGGGAPSTPPVVPGDTGGTKAELYSVLAGQPADTLPAGSPTTTVMVGSAPVAVPYIGNAPDAATQSNIATTIAANAGQATNGITTGAIAAAKSSVAAGAGQEAPGPSGAAPLSELASKTAAKTESNTGGAGNSTTSTTKQKAATDEHKSNAT